MPPSPPPVADRNLLFGVLALQLDFVDRDALVAGMNAWAVDKARPLGRVLCDQGALSAARLALLDALVDEHVGRHQGDVAASLEAIAAAGHSTLSEAFAGVADPGARSTLSALDGPIRLVPPPVRDQTRYRNLRPHARGGLGQVFLADDAELHREVAVKEIQLHRADDPASRARFVREAEITGALEHPGVIPVYALGTHPDGRPYYAMRFVRGETLKAAIDRFHEGGAADRADLRRLLGRFVDVCNAAAYAHSRGVVHRDIKPQNVMLGPFGETLLVDWGLAKAGVERPAPDPVNDPTVDPAVRPTAAGSAPSPTLAGSALGTPGYMSPEQAAGLHDRVGPASDVFSLGATLYCVLTGRKPFDGTGVDDEVERTRKGEFPAPRELNPNAPPGLDAVCRKAMARDPADRYPSALDLAADVERWLADEPVTVYRDPPGVRAMRWARRHRTAVAAAAVLVVTATVGLGLGTALLWREERRTRDEFERAELEHQAAERNFQTARGTILDMGRQVEAIETGQANSRQTDLKRRAALDSARKQFESFLADNPDDRVLKKQLAALHRYAGNLSRLLGDFADAERSYLASVALWEELARGDPGDASNLDNLALTLGDTATVQKRGGRLGEATKTLDRSAALAEEIKDRVPLPWYQRTLATALLSRADVEYRRGDFAAAERAAGRAAGLYDALQDAPPGQRRQQDPVFAAIAVRSRGTALREMGKATEAIKALDDAVARTEALGGQKGDRDVRHNANKSRLERATTGPGDAVGQLGQVIRDADKLAAEFPTTPLYKEVLTEALVRRGGFAAAADPEQAAADFERALAITRELVDKYGQQPDHVGLRGRAYYGKGQVLLSAGKKPEAGTAFGLAVAVYDVARKADPENVHVRRGLDQAEAAARANPKPARP